MAKETDDFVMDGGAVSLDDELAVSPAPVGANDPVATKAKKLANKIAKDAREAAALTTDQPKRGLFYFDLETQPDYDRLSKFDLEPLPEIPEPTAIEKLPDPNEITVGTENDAKKLLLQSGVVYPEEWLAKLMLAEQNGKGRAGVQNVIKQAGEVRGKAIEAHADRQRLLSTTPEYLRICSFAWGCDGGEINCLVSPQNNILMADGTKLGKYAKTASEVEILQTFWDVWAAMQKLVGYHILGFDLPAIFFRSMILMVKSTRPIDMKSWGDDVIDCYKKRYGEKPPTHAPAKLKTQAKLCGIDIPAGDISGADVDTMMKEGAYAEVAQYNMSDVHILREYHGRFVGTFW